MKTAQKSAEDFASRTASFAKDNEQHLDRVGKASMVMGGALIAGVALAVKSFMEFDSAMSEVQASTHESAANMDLLREAAVNAGADTSFSAKEAAQGIDELAKAGVSTKDILGGGLAGALSLAAAGSLDVAEAAEISASALTQFKLSGDKVPHLADLLAAGAGKAQGSVHDLGMALNQTGLVAASTGLTIEETTGGLAAFASAGLVGSDAGTSMKTMLQRLTPQSKEAAEKMAELGISAYDSQGKFIGLSKFAENLKTSMADLTPQARNAAMGIIFGSDAVRAANVLYEQGGKGISDWTDKVNDSGFAAVTASIKQDNLAGDIEKLGGSFDSLLIKSGGGLAESLRGIVQGLEDMVDTVGKIPTPILNAGAGIAGIAGVTALAAGAVMTALPKFMEFKSSFDELSSKAPKAASGIEKVGKAAAAAATAMVALQIVGALFTDKQVKSAEDYGQAILKVAKASDAAAGSKELDSLFAKWDTFAGEGPDIRDLAGAVKEVVNPHIPAGIQDTLDTLFSWTGSAKNDLGQVRDTFRGLGDEMGNLVKNGAAETAAKNFQALTKEFEAQGKGAKEALDVVPGYKDALLDLANQAGVTLEGQDLLDFAMGKVPASMQTASTAVETYTSMTGEAKPVTEAMAKALEDLGISASGTVTNLDKFTTALINAGLLTLSSRDATGQFDAALEGLDGKIKNIMATEQAHGGVLNESKTDLDIYSDAGRAANGVLDDMTQKGFNAAKAMAANGDSMPAVQEQLNKTYDAMVNTAKGFGLGTEQSEALIRSILHIPAGVDVKTWMSDEAKRMADQTTGAINNIPKQVYVDIWQTTHDITLKKTIEDPGGMGSSIGGRENGSMRGGMATGGRVYGPGTTTSDSIPVMLSKDEYVLKASAAKAIGYDNLNRLNGADTQPLRAGFQYSPAAAPARQSVAAAEPVRGSGVSVGAINITQVDDPIGTSHAVTRRMSALAI
jgi:TP901 family phage tail tape measure protein